MAKPPRFQVTKTPAGQYRVNVPAPYSSTGRRERKFFSTRDAAKAFASGLRAQFMEHGRNATGINPVLAADAIRARALLDAAGLEETLVAIANAAIATHKAAQRSALVHEATAAWLAATAHLAPATVQAYRYAAKRMNAGLPGRRLSSIEADEVLPALGIADASGAAALKIFVSFRAFTKWCAKPPREWLDAGHLLARIQAPEAKNDGEVKLISPEALEALLRAAETHFPALCGWLAIQAFAGVRVAEASRLRPADVSPAGIEIAAHAAKTGLRRHVQPNATLAAWLAVHPFQPAKPNAAEVRTLRRLAGWQVQSPLLAEPPPATRGKWPQNCLRHSYASAAVALGDPPLERLLFQFGHVGASPSLLRRHYLGRVSPETATAYFSIMPTTANQ